MNSDSCYSGREVATPLSLLQTAQNKDQELGILLNFCLSYRITGKFFVDKPGKFLAKNQESFH